MRTELNDPRHIALVEWLVSDPRERGTAREFAASLEVAERTVRGWKEREDVQKRWGERAVEVGGDPERLQRVMDALYSEAVDSESAKQVQAASTWAKLAGAIKPPKTEHLKSRADMKGLTDEQVAAMVAEFVAGQNKTANN